MPKLGAVLRRCFTLQAAWNYERMLGTGFGWAAAPALRAIAGEDEARLRGMIARQSTFFNAHPYLAGLAIGAALRAEHDREPPERIARLREALCGPLGSVGDRLFWAAWLPASAAVGLVCAALGAGVWAVVAFLVMYNAAHVYVRRWALQAGWSRGLHVAAALSTPLLRLALTWTGPLAAFGLGLALPLAFAAQLRGAAPAVWAWAALAAALFALVVRALRRVSGVALAVVVLGVTWLAGFAWR